MTINYELFARLMNRSGELARQAGIPSMVRRVYNERLKERAEGFLSADAALTRAMGADRKESSEAKRFLGVLDRPYTLARATALAYKPHLVLPETLKAAPTDTDKMNAIETLLDVVEAAASQGWAQDLLSGPFGTVGPSTVKEIDEAIRADASLSAARQARAQAYGPAYDEYLSFKRVVRMACGPRSREYHRIHLRSVQPGEPQED